MYLAWLLFNSLANEKKQKERKKERNLILSKQLHNL
jgi:hypothetical protein